jgi:hypothetical protein
MMHISEEALLDYLYDEAEPAERLKVARHLQDCATCSVAVVELQAVRGVLHEWTPPSAELGFRIVREPVEAQPPAPWFGAWRAGWMQAAAAILLFAAGVGVSQLHVTYVPGEITLRTPSAAAMRAASVRLPAPAPSGTEVPVTASSLAALERTVKSELTSSQAGSSAATEEVIRRVRAMIEESEDRQQRQLALRLSQVARELDTQRRADLMRVEQNFGQLENMTGASIAEQNRLMDYIVKTSGGVK